MFHPLQSLFRHTKIGWEEVDIKYYMERYLHTKVKSDQLYCEKVHGGVAVVRVGSATLQQEIMLLEFDIRREVLAATNYRIRQLVVYVSA